MFDVLNLVMMKQHRAKILIFSTLSLFDFDKTKSTIDKISQIVYLIICLRIESEIFFRLSKVTNLNTEISITLSVSIIQPWMRFSFVFFLLTNIYKNIESE